MAIVSIGEYLSEHRQEEAPQETKAEVAQREPVTSTAIDIAADWPGEASDKLEEAVSPVEPHSPQIVFDRYHVVAKTNEAVDELRRAESKTRPELKRPRYVWLKNEANLTAKQHEKLAWLTRPSMRLETTRAAGWRDDFNDLYKLASTEEAETYLRRWCYGAKRSRLEPVKEFVATVVAHWDGIIAWQQSRPATGCSREQTRSSKRPNAGLVATAPRPR